MKVKKVPIDLDRRRHIVYDMNAVYELEQRYGSFMKSLKTLREDAFEDTTTLMYFGLLHEDAELTEEDTDRMLAGTLRIEIIKKILQAVSFSLPDSNKEQQATHNPPDESEGWEWDWLYYIGTVLLGMSEAVFWSCTPQRFFALWAIHKRFNRLEESRSTDQSAAQAWIDQYI